MSDEAAHLVYVRLAAVWGWREEAQLRRLVRLPTSLSEERGRRVHCETGRGEAGHAGWAAGEGTLAASRRGLQPVL